MTLLLPYAQAGLIDRLRREASLRALDYEPEHIRVRAVVGPELYSGVKQYLSREEA